jgi:hypothetical protein
MLLAANADINATCKDGDTPLALAQLHDQKAVMRVLFTHAETTGGTPPIEPLYRLTCRLWVVAAFRQK